jgi:hypothetical protein
MSWLFSQALVEEYSGVNCLDGAPSVQSSGCPIQQAYCAPDRMTKLSKASQFGMTFKPLTDDLGEALLMSYREVFRAKISQLQEEAQGSMVTDPPCGDIWQGSSMKYDPDSSLWKTLQCSLPEASTKSSVTLPRSGMTLGGRLWALPMLEPRTKEKGFGWWRTPDTGAGGTSGLLKQGITHRPNGQPIQIRLVDQVNNPHLWATPTVMDHLPARQEEALKRQYDKNRAGRTSHSTLREQVVYPPPKTMWPTPAATDYKGSGKTGTLRDRLDYATERGATKTRVYGEPALTGQLNPNWVEWLMGWPVGWSDLKQLETGKFHSVLPKLGDI